MDLLCSLGLEELPEQATRLTSHTGIIKALESDSDARLGFNLCCNCGTKLPDDAIKPKSSEKSNKASSKVVKCKGCQRVRYCSNACCKADSEEVPAKKNSNLDQDTAIGHSAVICSLLGLCHGDEDAEEESFDTKTKDAKSNSQKKGNNEAASYRVQTERESYPATLFNILAESPTWFMEAMTRRIRYLEDPRSPEKQRRGKRDRLASPNRSEAVRKTGNKDLVLHVVGASIDSELWGWSGKDENPQHSEVLKAYAEASTNIVGYLDNFPIILESIRLIFIGPDCPKYCKVNVPIPDSKTVLTIETHRCNYGEQNQPKSSEPIPSPDVIVFFNPGFSCPDYDWSKALSAAATPPKIEAGGSTSFLVTTNTEMEGFADIKCLLDGGYIDAKSLPADILEAIDYPVPKANKHETNEEHVTFFFGENPYHGLRVRQSGTMANDVYVKSRWMFGGLFRKTGAFIKRKAKENNENEKDEGMQKQAKKKHRRGNSKKSNPALI